MSHVSQEMIASSYLTHDDTITSCETWLIYTLDMTHLYVRHDSSILWCMTHDDAIILCEPWLIYMWDLTHLYSETWLMTIQSFLVRYDKKRVMSHKNWLHRSWKQLVLSHTKWWHRQVLQEMIACKWGMSHKMHRDASHIQMSHVSYEMIASYM